MNSKQAKQEAASKRRRKMKTRKFQKIARGTKHSRSIEEYFARMIGQGHAHGGRKPLQGSPEYHSRRGKFKGYMRQAC